jgi:cation diffusion facilitator CzcD-associated flavoprotein CzcO
MRCAIVGSGLAALATYATLRHGGIAAEEIVVFGTHEDPTAVWRARAASIRQQRMRSESDGHLAATSFPGLAFREAARTGVLTPLVLSVTNRYHPTVEDFLRHAEEVRARTGWDGSFREERIERITPVPGGFELDGNTFAHVLLATGHPGLHKPPEWPDAAHAYEPHEYTRKVAVVGAGMAAATEWLNALAAGSEVVSVRRREPLRRPLNVPRPLFSKRGLAAYHASSDERRAAKLRELSLASYPPGSDWDEPLQRAEREARFRVLAETPADHDVIVATGFKRGYRHDPLLSRLVEENELPTRDRWLVLDDDSTVPALTDASRTLSVAGVAGQWAFPAGDTIAGAKYAARAFLRRACRTP